MWSVECEEWSVELKPSTAKHAKNVKIKRNTVGAHSVRPQQQNNDHERHEKHENIT